MRVRQPGSQSKVPIHRRGDVVTVKNCSNEVDGGDLYSARLMHTNEAFLLFGLP